MEPGSKAFEKLKNAKTFDPKRSSVLEVLNDQQEGNFTVDVGINGEDDSNSGRKIWLNTFIKMDIMKKLMILGTLMWLVGKLKH